MNRENREQIEIDKIGNTESMSISKKTRNQQAKQGNQRVKWFFTYNNFPIEEKREIEETFRKNCKKFIYEKEIGSKSHIEHLQGCCSFNAKKGLRLTEVKKIFKKHPGIHWRETINESASIEYCTKDATCNADITSKNVYTEKMLFFDLLEDATNRLFNFEYFYNDCIDELINEYKHSCDEIEDVALVQNQPLWKILRQCYTKACNDLLTNIQEHCIYEDYLQHCFYKETLEQKLAKLKNI